MMMIMIINDHDYNHQMEDAATCLWLVTNSKVCCEMSIFTMSIIIIKDYVITIIISFVTKVIMIVSTAQVADLQ